MLSRGASRRRFPKSGVVLAGAGVLAACGATPTPQVIEKVVEREVTKIVEGTPQVVKETVVVEQVVERTVVVEVTAPVPAAEGPLFLVFATQNSGPPTNIGEQQLVAQFEEANPGIKVKLATWPGQDFHDKLRLLATAGDLPDAFDLETKQTIDMISRGMFLDITELFTSDSGLTKDDYWPNEWEKAWFRGKQYTLPLDTQNGIIFYNKTLFDAKGIPYPPKDWDDKTWTYDALLEAALNITEGEGPTRKWGFVTSRGFYWSYPQVWSFGGLVTNEDRTESRLTMPETIDAYQYRGDLINKHKVMPPPADMTEGTETMFTSGRLGMHLVWSPWSWYIKDVPELKWDIGVTPYGAGGSFTRGPQDCVAIGAQTKHPKEAFQVGMYMAGPDGQRLLCNEIGLGLPTLMKVAEEESSVRPHNVPGLEHLGQTLLLELYRKGHVKHQDVTIKWPEMTRMIQPELDKLLEGTATAEEMCKTLDPQITELLQSIPEEWRGWIGD